MEVLRVQLETGTGISEKSRLQDRIFGIISIVTAVYEKE